jgi:hypothetical protein
VGDDVFVAGFHAGYTQAAGMAACLLLGDGRRALHGHCAGAAVMSRVIDQ